MLCPEVPPRSPRARAWETLAAQFPIPGLHAVPALTVSVPARPSGTAWNPGGQTLLTLVLRAWVTEQSAWTPGSCSSPGGVVHALGAWLPICEMGDNSTCILGLL